MRVQLQKMESTRKGKEGSATCCHASVTKFIAPISPPHLHVRPSSGGAWPDWDKGKPYQPTLAALCHAPRHHQDRQQPLPDPQPHHVGCVTTSGLKPLGEEGCCLRNPHHRGRDLVPWSSTLSLVLQLCALGGMEQTAPPLSTPWLRLRAQQHMVWRDQPPSKRLWPPALL